MTTAKVMVPESEEPVGEVEDVEVYEDPPEDPNEQALALPDKLRALTIVDQASLDIALAYRMDIKAFRTRVNEEFDKGIHQAYEHHRHLTAQKRKYTDRLDEADKINNPKIATYLDEQDRIRYEAQRAAQLAKEKIEREAQEAADKAQALIEKGRVKEADKVVERAAERIEQIQVAAPVVPEKTYAAGTTLREDWTFEITNVELIPRKFLVPDLTMIRRYGQNMKHQAVVPGVRFYTVKSVMSRSR